MIDIQEGYYQYMSVPENNLGRADGNEDLVIHRWERKPQVGRLAPRSMVCLFIAGKYVAGM